MNSPFPQSYDEWQHCITVECGIPLTASFVAQRLAILGDKEAQETRRFRNLYGDDYWQLVVGWFERAAKELGTAA